MRTDVKRTWLDALRSGRYRQGEGKLTRHAAIPESDDAHHCCLGVLCALAVDAGIVRAAHLGGLTVYGVAQAQNFLPHEVVAWAGLPSTNPVVIVDGPDDATQLTTSLADLNDEGWSFDGIADVIEVQL